MPSVQNPSILRYKPRSTNLMMNLGFDYRYNLKCKNVLKNCLIQCFRLFVSTVLFLLFSFACFVFVFLFCLKRWCDNFFTDLTANWSRQQIHKIFRWKKAEVCVCVWTPDWILLEILNLEKSTWQHAYILVVSQETECKSIIEEYDELGSSWLPKMYLQTTICSVRHALCRLTFWFFKSFFVSVQTASVKTDPSVKYLWQV